MNAYNLNLKYQDIYIYSAIEQKKIKPKQLSFVFD